MKNDEFITVMPFQDGRRKGFRIENPKEFFLRIHLLGFRADNHNYTLKRLLNKELLNTKFSSNPVVPEVFRGLPISAPTEDVYETA